MVEFLGFIGFRGLVDEVKSMDSRVMGGKSLMLHGYKQFIGLWLKVSFNMLQEG